MSSRGYIKFYRSTLTHPFFRDDAERMAWLRLLSAAAWKPQKKRAGEFFVELQRGEVVGAVRYLAAEWAWSKGKVERFIIRLRNEGMVETRTETGITVITICNYNEFQGADEDGGTPMDEEPGQDRDAPGTGPGQGRDAGGDNKEEINNSRRGKREEGETDSGSALTLFGDEPGKPKAAVPPVDYEGMFAAWYEIYPKKVDRTDALKSFARVLKTKAATFEQLVAGVRRYSAEVAGTEKKYIKAPAVWLNKGSWDNEPAGSPSAPARSGRVGSALQGIASRITQEDFDDGYR